MRAIYDRHSAFTQQSRDFVLGEALTDQIIHRIGSPKPTIEMCVL
jgi:hypothetical protein